MDLIKSIKISAAGMQAQGTRLRVISENLANSDSLAERPGEQPYRRKLASFASELNRKLGVHLVTVGRARTDPSEFGVKYDPDHPGADATGYVRLPNVSALIETMDMREAQRSYEANLMAIDAAKRMMMRTIDLLKS